MSFSPIQLFEASQLNKGIARSAAGNSFNGVITAPEKEITSSIADFDTGGEILIRVPVLPDPNGNANVRVIPNLASMCEQGNLSRPLLKPETFFRMNQCKIAMMPAMSISAQEPGAEYECSTLSTNNRLNLVSTSPFAVNGIIQITANAPSGLTLNQLYSIKEVVSDSYITLKNLTNGNEVAFTHGSATGVKFKYFGTELKLAQFRTGSSLSQIDSAGHGMSVDDIVVFVYGTTSSNRFGAVLGSDAGGENFSSIRQFVAYRVISVSTNSFTVCAIEGSQPRTYSSAGTPLTRFWRLSGSASVADNHISLVIQPENFIPALNGTITFTGNPEYCWFNIKAANGALEPGVRQLVRIQGNFNKLLINRATSGNGNTGFGGGGAGGTTGGAGFVN